MDLIEEYIGYYPKKSRKTKKDRRMVLEMFKEYMDKPLKEVKRSDVQEWVSHLERKRLKGSTIQQYLSVIKNFYKFMPKKLPKPVTPEETREVLEKRDEYDGIRDVEGPSIRGSEKVAFSTDQILELVENAKRRVHGKIFTILAYTGMRRDELRLLTKDMVDFEKNEINIPFEITKSYAGERAVPFCPFIKDLLEESKGKYVIGGKKPYSQSFFHWSDYDDVLGFHFKTHSFRYTFDTHMGDILEEEFGIGLGRYVLKRLMGHKVGSDDLSEYYRGETTSFEEDRKRAMRELHYYNRDDLFGRLGEHFF